MKKVYYFLLIIQIFQLVSCKKDNTSNNNGNNTNLSAADKIAGLFNGTGKYLPGGVDLGYTVVCSPPPTNYQTLYQTGTATINITKLTDSTVKIGLLSGPFPQDNYPEIKVTTNGNMIQFYQGYYDINTKVILFAGTAPNYSFSYSANCKTGLPFYSSALFPGPSGTPVYFNNTIKRYEFSGTKQ